MNNAPSLLDIRAFVAIAEQQSFTKAAEQLNISRAHLSRQLSALESTLGVQLIIRTTRSQRLTDSGERFFLECRQALSSVDRAVLETIEGEHSLSGTVNINCVGGLIGEEIVGGLLGEFMTLYPDIKLNLDFSSPRVDLIENAFDLVIRMGQLDDSNLVARRLTELPISIVASPAYLERQAPIKHPKSLAEHNCLTGSIRRWRFINAADANKTPTEVNVSGNLQAKNGRALLQAALAGGGIVRLPTLYCQQYIEQGQLQPLFDQWHCESVPLYLLYHKNRYQPERLSKLISFLKQGFQARLDHR
ncbi:DNA-binding transcriptional LysR family regulator [Sinobacterium caligoides]|uniref:DNA-binding transcriptional LysR family regulator n=1 Tax=Sinobacterium caligoides TaxID=933926 RepID=A0A3N2DZ65_9GAMM|nr:LysR family transcriptional regulator [Sinobacterium caligoides]ROS05161.1 DNA-binding transcriptional LysR family regulator [Sinobacterium caligoides]